MQKDWKDIDCQWHGEKVNDSDKRYHHSPSNDNYSCAYDCALWVAIQLDAWRRKADEFDDRTYIQQACENFMIPTMKYMVRHLWWGRSSTRGMRNYLRNLLPVTNDKGLADVTAVLDQFLTGLPQLMWIQLDGVHGSDKREVDYAANLYRRYKVTVRPSDGPPNASFGQLISAAMMKPKNGNQPPAGSHTLVAGTSPYVLRVMLVPSLGGESPLSWRDLLESYSEKGLVEIDINFSTVCHDTIGSRKQLYQLCGVVFHQKGRVGHYTAVWRRGEPDTTLHYDGLASERVRVLALESPHRWCLDGTLVPVSLFYEVVLAGSDVT